LIPVLFRGWLSGEIRVGVDEGIEARVSLGVGYLPGKPPKNHTQEDDGYTPDINLPRIIGFFGEDLWGEIGVAADNACRWCWRLARIVKDGGSAKVDELNDIVCGHDAVIELEVTMGKAHFMEILDTIADLTEYTVDFRSTHLSGHDDTEEIKGSVLHDLDKISASDKTMTGFNIPHNSGHGQRRYRQSR
jgi:hypothetical protein